MKINTSVDISKIVEKSKVVSHSLLRNHRKLGDLKPRNHLEGLGKLLQGNTDGLVINQKRVDFRQQLLSPKELILTLALRYQGILFPEVLMK